MDWTYFHLTTNHIPVIGAIFGTVILAWGMLRREGPVRSVGLLIMIVTGLIAIPVYLTGEPAEEAVEKLPGVLETIIEEHEEFAKFALIAGVASGLASLGAFLFSLFRPEGRTAKTLLFVTLISSAITVGMMGWTAKLGGVIRHTEIRGGGAQSTTSDAAETKRGRDEDEDH